MNHIRIKPGRVFFFILTNDEHKVNTNTRQLLFKTSIYMTLTELQQKRESNSKAYASESDSLPPSYPQAVV